MDLQEYTYALETLRPGYIREGIFFWKEPFFSDHYNIYNKCDLLCAYRLSI